MMAAIRSGDTRPEMAVRSFLHKHGFRFRLHARALPGRPDVVLVRYRTVIFVHGCFWHRHARCRYAYVPKSNVAFWRAKFRENQRRDARAQRALKTLGWDVVVVWECRTSPADLERLAVAIRRRGGELGQC